MRRAYKETGIAPEVDGFAVLLDGKPMRTPAGLAFRVPGSALAAAIAAEWAAQDTLVRPDRMPLSQIAATAIDRVGTDPAATVAAIARFGETDLVCYRAEAPVELVERQHAALQPLVDWAALTLDAALRVTAGVMPAAQPPAATAALRRAVERFDPWRLAPVGLATAASGSLIIALALAFGRLDAEAAWSTSQVEESFQIERWGEDAEAAERRRALRGDLHAAARFLALLDQ